MENIQSPYELSPAAEEWASKRRQKISGNRLRDKLLEQQGRCALSNVLLFFDKNEGTPQKGGQGVHPLYPAVDHLECGNDTAGFQIVCYALNDVKGHMPRECFEELQETTAWKKLMAEWRKLANTGATRRQFRRLIFPHGNRKHRD